MAIRKPKNTEVKASDIINNMPSDKTAKAKPEEKAPKEAKAPVEKAPKQSKLKYDDWFSATGIKLLSSGFSEFSVLEKAAADTGKKRTDAVGEDFETRLKSLFK